MAPDLCLLRPTTPLFQGEPGTFATKCRTLDELDEIAGFASFATPL